MLKGAPAYEAADADRALMPTPSEELEAWPDLATALALLPSIIQVEDTDPDCLRRCGASSPAALHL